MPIARLSSSRALQPGQCTWGCVASYPVAVESGPRPPMVNRGPCACWLASWLMYSFAARQDGLLSLFEVVGALRPVPGLGLLQVQPITDRLRDVLRLHPAIGQLGDPSMEPAVVTRRKESLRVRPAAADALAHLLRDLLTLRLTVRLGLDFGFAVA